MTRIDDIMTVLRQGPATVPQIAEIIGDKPDHVATKMPVLVRQGVVREVGRSPAQVCIGAAVYAMWNWQGPWQVFPGLNVTVLKVKGHTSPKRFVRSMIIETLRDAEPMTVKEIASEIYSLPPTKVPKCRCDTVRSNLWQMQVKGEVRITPSAGQRAAKWELVA